MLMNLRMLDWDDELLDLLRVQIGRAHV